MPARKRLLSTTALGTMAAMGLALPAFAGDPYGLPAVSAPNGKLGAFAGAAGNTTAIGGFGAFSMPLGGQLGAQVDALAGAAGGGGVYGVAGHFFWRDPARGLLGAYASVLGWDSITGLPVPIPADGTIGKVGVEGELYLSRLSLEGLAAYQFGTNSGFAGKATVALYPTDDLRLDLSVRTLAGSVWTGVAGGEWQPKGSALSLFTDAGIGGQNTWFARAGIKVYFGDSRKSLIQRHRQDDPEVDLPDDFYTIVGDGFCPAGARLTRGFCDSNS